MALQADIPEEKVKLVAFCRGNKKMQISLDAGLQMEI
jgi:hypothetical protein